MSNVIMFPLHRTKAWQEHKRSEREFVDAPAAKGDVLREAGAVDLIELEYMASTLDEMNRELYRNLGLEYPGPA